MFPSLRRTDLIFTLSGRQSNKSLNRGTAWLATLWAMGLLGHCMAARAEEGKPMSWKGVKLAPKFGDGWEGREWHSLTVQGVYVGVTVVGTELGGLWAHLSMLVTSLQLFHSHIFNREGTYSPSVQTGNSTLLLQDSVCTWLGTA